MAIFTVVSYTFPTFLHNPSLNSVFSQVHKWLSTFLCQRSLCSDCFAGYKILLWQLLSLSTLEILLYCHLVAIVADEKSAISLIMFPSLVICFSDFSFISSSVILKYSGVNLILFMLVSICGALLVWSITSLILEYPILKLLQIFLAYHDTILFFWSY